MANSVAIPPAMKAEHQLIHAALVAASDAPGQIGVAARTLARLLHPHFVREEEIALPPLGLLSPLAAGIALTLEEVSDLLAMTTALQSELPRMLEEHVAIRAAVDVLRAAALAEQSTEHVRLADQLALHAQTEEQVLYPAAMVIGALVRARTMHPSVG